jgi:hypothetical protein
VYYNNTKYKIIRQTLRQHFARLVLLGFACFCVLVLFGRARSFAGSRKSRIFAPSKKQMLIMYPFEMENISVGNKRAYLKANGWLPVWNDDNWEDAEILKKSSNPDWCGMPVNEAYQVCKWHVFRRELLRVMRLPLVSFATDFDEHNNCVYKMVWNEGEKTYSIDTLFNGYYFLATLSFETHSSSFEGLTTKRLSIPAAHGFPRKIENIIQFVELFRKSIRKYEP